MSVVSLARPDPTIPAARPSRLLAILRCSLTVSAIIFALPQTAIAQQSPSLPLPRLNYGGVGMLDMPSARMGLDGELSFSASYMKDTQHYNLGFNIFPWLEASFRYSGLSHFDPSYPVYWDRAFGIKARLLEEGDILPSIAVGMNDLIGTGAYSGEYVVASKQFGDFDASVGVGWGRLGTANTFRNPLHLIFHSFDTRPDPFGTARAGGTLFKTLFHGPAGVFGGLTWRTPVDGLSLIIENSSDGYSVERARGSFKPNSQINYGMSYQLTDNVTLGVGYLYGNTFNANVSFQFDPTRPQFPLTVGEPVPPVVVRSQDEQSNALRTLAGQRDPSYLRARVRAATRNSFVDELTANRGVADLVVNGHVLVVTTTGSTTPELLCRLAANSAAGSGTGITDVKIRGGDGKILARCDLPRPLEAPLRTVGYTIGGPALVSHRQPMLIDATDAQAPVDNAAAVRKFQADARKQGIEILAVSFSEFEATVYYSNYHYQDEADAIQRLTRLLMADAPPSVEKFRLVAVQSSIPQQEYHILRAPAERAMTNEMENGSVFTSPVDIASPPLYNPILSAETRQSFPRFDWSVYPQFRQQFFDPSNPVGIQVVGALEASVELSPGLSIWGQVEGSAFDTFSTNRKSDSLLPHVRTDFVNYFTEGKNGIGALQVNYRTRLTPQFYATVRAGILESMFTGAGGEVLYRPDGGRWAIGADLYEVWQRNFDRLFGLQNYRVTTGHVSLYWASPFYDLDFQVRAGQYLAGDRGLTLQITRRFSTGVEVGAFFTKTNVSSQTFGEGSFDKGIVIRIPLGWVAPINTQNAIAMDLRPVQRDGGQTLLGDATLYSETRRTSQSELARTGAIISDGW
jgi:hypothetical protein